jgi:hypothetical protein
VEDDENMIPIYTIMIGASYEKESSKGVQVKKETQG